MSQLPSQFKHTTKYILVNEARLALHSWIPENPQGVIFYVHGIQSHGGWLFETGPDLAKESLAVFVLDRRGAGLSEGMRGDIPCANQLISDYWFVLNRIKDCYPKLPLTLLGHSLGGSILAGMLGNPKFDIHYDSVVFCASALGKRHDNQSKSKKPNQKEGTELITLNLDENAFTSDSRYLEFMRNDKLFGGQITARTEQTLFNVEEYYYGKRGIIKCPSVYFYPRIDPLVNTEKAMKVFFDMNADTGITLQIPTDKHYLWFTNQRLALVRWLSHYVRSRGYEANV